MTIPGAGNEKKPVRGWRRRIHLSRNQKSEDKGITVEGEKGKKKKGKGQ